MEIKNARVLVLGITFKENCPDVRNTKVVDVINNLVSAEGMLLSQLPEWSIM